MCKMACGMLHHFQRLEQDRTDSKGSSDSDGDEEATPSHPHVSTENRVTKTEIAKSSPRNYFTAMISRSHQISKRYIEDRRCYQDALKSSATYVNERKHSQTECITSRSNVSVPYALYKKQDKEIYQDTTCQELSSLVIDDKEKKDIRGLNDLPSIDNSIPGSLVVNPLDCKDGNNEVPSTNELDCASANTHGKNLTDINTDVFKEEAKAPYSSESDGDKSIKDNSQSTVQRKKFQRKYDHIVRTNSSSKESFDSEGSSVSESSCPSDNLELAHTLKDIQSKLHFTVNVNGMQEMKESIEADAQASEEYKSQYDSTDFNNMSKHKLLSSVNLTTASHEAIPTDRFKLPEVHNVRRHSLADTVQSTHETFRRITTEADGVRNAAALVRTDSGGLYSRRPTVTSISTVPSLLAAKYQNRRSSKGMQAKQTSKDLYERALSVLNRLQLHRIDEKPESSDSDSDIDKEACSRGPSSSKGRRKKAKRTSGRKKAKSESSSKSVKNPFEDIKDAADVKSPAPKKLSMKTSRTNSDDSIKWLSDETGMSLKNAPDRSEIKGDSFKISSKIRPPMKVEIKRTSSADGRTRFLNSSTLSPKRDDLHGRRKPRANSIIGVLNVTPPSTNDKSNDKAHAKTRRRTHTYFDSSGKRKSLLFLPRLDMQNNPSQMVSQTMYPVIDVKTENNKEKPFGS